MEGVSQLKKSHALFVQALGEVLPKAQIYTELAVRFAYGTDASCYRYVPEVVVRAQNEKEVLNIMQLAAQYHLPITFRASGTSLSGQTSSDSILVLLGDEFVDAKILDKGDKIKLRPMVIGSNANLILKPFGRKIGPDPATINTARIGGIAANNSSGMCCGTKDNSYHTLDTMRVILADGTILDTADAKSIADFKASHGQFLADLKGLSDLIRSNPELESRIRHKYRLKNTTGYGINALVDFDDPIDMLTHLMIGSEGTLGFISEITYKTVVDHPHKASALIYFDDLDNCCNAVTALRQQATVDSVELLDARSIRCVGENIVDRLPSFFYQEIPEDSGCLLIETKAKDDAMLDEQIAFINQLVADHGATEHSTFSKDTVVTDLYWSVRKGLLPIIGGNRPLGSNLITEDVAFPIERLAEGMRALTKLLKAYGYEEGMIMGHALEGNLHFILTPKLDSDAEVSRYNGFMAALAEIVAVEFNGSLKAEHGTGRNIAPFVKVEWGEDAYGIMRSIKALFDPLGILNPDVIITDDPHLHLKKLKAMPESDPIIDQCIECGLCEPACPSDGLSLTPRQRIVLWRQHEHLTRTGEHPELLASIQKVYPYMGIDTCATTGMCATRCPIGINTGEMMKSLKTANRQPDLANYAESHINFLSKTARTMLKGAHVLGAKRSHGITKSLHSMFKGIPILPEHLPKAAKPIAPIVATDQTPVVYFVSCVNRTFAEGTKEATSVADHTLSLFKKAGYRAIFPEDYQSLCCGQPFDSLKEVLASERAANRVNQALLQASQDGQYPVYIDNAPCALRLFDAQEQGLIDARLKLYDAASFLAAFVLPKLTIVHKREQLSLHIPCSATKMNSGTALTQLAAACTDSLNFTNIACCGYAGNKGMFLPELNANALRLLKQNIPSNCEHGVSMSRTCQMGLTEHSGIEYHSIEALLNHCSG
ncbi:FAD-binding oxidoreductase [Wohlfahrtiimonas chitiniclastica]|uniref:FAD-binding and (Fe-S)-binding domain-containing protein n=1 Tax=Wohlfahrtiimonas chitiniclastica TaxID=400946 RepID=UPI000B99A522|nr:FAD-binding and (Fe-S)-binding domain-containing protein [Wohlfahrtiimonas chitiniclastica]MBS7828825.1 FAD-binding oxidoreductase [Wohlfahrtiimonas chitiniclastica]OYQ89333.1 4Fe-4S ferredoxin [Wohlfahrtiimonas chitiniclastica]